MIACINTVLTAWFVDTGVHPIFLLSTIVFFAVWCRCWGVHFLGSDPAAGLQFRRDTAFAVVLAMIAPVHLSRPTSQSNIFQWS